MSSNCKHSVFGAFSPETNLTCDCSFITHHTISGKNLTGSDFLKRKDRIAAALDEEIKHGDMDMLASIRRNKRTL